MTPPALTQKHMLAILLANGFNTLSNRYWDRDGIERIIMGKENFNFAFKLKKFYFFPEVIKRCKMLGIEYKDIPEDIREEFATCLKEWDKTEEQKKGVVGSTDEIKENPEQEEKDQDKG